MTTEELTTASDTPSHYLMPLLKRYWWQIGLAAIVTGLAAGIVLYFGQLVRDMVDFGFLLRDYAYVDEAAITLGIVVAIFAAVSFSRVLAVSWVAEKMTADLRLQLFNHLLKQSPYFFENNASGDIVARLTSDTGIIQNVVERSFPVVLRNGTLFLGGLTMLLLSSVKLTGIILIIVPPLGLLMNQLGRRVRRYSRAGQDAVGVMSGYADEVLREIKTVQTHTHEAVDTQIFGDKVRDTFRIAMKQVTLRGILAFCAIFVVFMAIVALLWVGGRDIISGEMTPGDLSAFLFYALLVAGSVGSLSDIFGESQRARGAFERLTTLLSHAPDIDDPEVATLLTHEIEGEIEFHNISFSYPSAPGKMILQDMELKIRPQQKVAVVGTSGTGKSTLFNLLLRFYEPQRGHITLDGTDIRDLSLKTLRQTIGIVPQDTVLFSGSVLDNIRYSRPDASEEDVVTAATQAAAHAFITALPHGYETQVGEKGIRLSGGQRQRLALARLFLRNPRIILLDEATTGLDADNEYKVQQGLERLMEGRTTLIVSHRIKTIQYADVILFMQNGKITDRGTHQALIRRNQDYRHLVELEFRNSTQMEEEEKPQLF